MARQMNSTQPFTDLLVKLIPTEIVGAYLVLAGILGFGTPTLTISQIPDDVLRIILIQVVFFVLLILTPLYLWKVSNVSSKTQLIVCTVSFAIWVYTLGGPFAIWGVYYPLIASVVLVLWSLITTIVLYSKRSQLR